MTYNLSGNALNQQTKAGDGGYLRAHEVHLAPASCVGLAPPEHGDSLRVESYLCDAFGRKVKRRILMGYAIAFFSPRSGPLGYIKTTTDELDTNDEAYHDDGLIMSVTEYLNNTTAMTSFDYGPFGLLKSVSRLRSFRLEE